MATFLTVQDALDAALEAQGALTKVEVAGHRPQMRAGIHWGRPRKLGGDYLGVDVNIAARVADAAKAEQVVLSDIALAQVELDGLKTTKAKRLRAQGAPPDLHYTVVERA
jgi:class 3 adenylate cyclase